MSCQRAKSGFATVFPVSSVYCDTMARRPVNLSKLTFVVNTVFSPGAREMPDFVTLEIFGAASKDGMEI